MPKIDIETAPTRWHKYPPPAKRAHRSAGAEALARSTADLSRFEVNLLRIAPGVWSSQRHWHTVEDEFTWVVSGEVVLVTDEGEQVLRAGDCAGFPAGAPNGHHFQNRSNGEAVLLEVGSRRPVEDGVDYPDIDLTLANGAGGISTRTAALTSTPRPRAATPAGRPRRLPARQRSPASGPAASALSASPRVARQISRSTHRRGCS